MFTLSIYDLTGKEVGTVELDKNVFDGKINLALLHQVILMYQANKRQGTASTKTRRDVSGGGTKPWRQKGTGRARVGSSRNPLWRKGGVAFGPHPRDYSYQAPKKVKTKALLSSLNSRLTDKQVKILEELKVDLGKTKEFIRIINALNLSRKILFVCDQAPTTLIRSSRNIKAVNIKGWQNLNALDVLMHDNLVITREALDQLTNRLKRRDK